jgi:chromosome segregation ATPase
VFFYLLQVPVQVEDGSVSVPVEALFALALAVAIWVFKWLIGREFSRFEDTLARHTAAIKQLQASDQSQQFDLTQVARLETAQQQAQQTVGELSERIQRLDNVGFALRQTQEMLQQTQKDLLTLKGEIAATYVSEDKFVRETAIMTRRIDAVWDRIDETLGQRRGGS